MAGRSGSAGFDPMPWRTWTPFEAGSSTVRVGAEMPAARILVADGRPEVRAMVERVPGNRCRCEYAVSVDEAREKLADGIFDLLLCDVNAEGEEGLALATRSPATTRPSRW